MSEQVTSLLAVDALCCLAASAPFFSCAVPLFMSNISPFTVVALNSGIVRRSVPRPCPCCRSPCESDEIQHVKKTSHVEGEHGGHCGGAEPEFGVTVAPRVVVDGWACEGGRGRDEGRQLLLPLRFIFAHKNFQFPTKGDGENFTTITALVGRSVGGRHALSASK